MPTTPDLTVPSAPDAVPATGAPGPLVVGVCGNPSGGSRTLALTAEVVDGIASGLPGATTRLVDLARLATRVLVWGDEDVAAARATVASADVVVVSTPVYKGAYTGLLKCFLDGFDAGVLRGRAAVPVTVAASPAHSLAGPSHLEPVLRELGLMVPGGTLHVPDRTVGDPEARAELVTAWLEERRALLAPTRKEEAR